MADILKRAGNISGKELAAYLLVLIFFLIMLMMTIIFSDNIKGKVVNFSSSAIGKASFGISGGYAALAAMQYSEEELAAEILSSKQELEDVLKENNLPAISDLTAEEEEMLMTGELSAEDAYKMLVSKNSETNYAIESLQEDGEAVKSGIYSSQEGDNADEIIGEKITRLYGLKAYYLGLLGSLFGQAKQEYNSLKGEGISAKSIANKYISEAAALESECDAKVYSVLSELEGELSGYGFDTSIIETIENAYIKEKRLKKSYYLGKL